MRHKYCLLANYDNMKLARTWAAGFTDAQIVEIVVVVALNFLTNLMNNAGATEIDFPNVYASAA